MNWTTIVYGESMQKVGRKMSKAFHARYTPKEREDGGKVNQIMVWFGGNLVASLWQSPDDLRVMNPGEFNGVIHTTDGGLMSTGHFRTPEEVYDKLMTMRGKTYEQLIR